MDFMSCPIQGTNTLVNTCNITWDLGLPKMMLGNNRTTMNKLTEDHKQNSKST